MTNPDMTRTSVFLPRWMVECAKANNINMSRILRESIYARLSKETVDHELTLLVADKLGAYRDCNDITPQMVHNMFWSWCQDFRMQPRTSQSDRKRVEALANKFIREKGIKDYHDQDEV